MQTKILNKIRGKRLGYKLGRKVLSTPTIVNNHLYNSIYDKKETISKDDLELLKKLYHDFVFDILGLKAESSGSQNDLSESLMNSILAIRQRAKENKDFATSDMIRDELKKLNIIIKDTKDGSVWSVED